MINLYHHIDLSIFMAYLIYTYTEHIGWTHLGWYQSLLVHANDVIASYSNHMYFHF
jgi:hypothetical protein